jgi:hypothetical protein
MDSVDVFVVWSVINVACALVHIHAVEQAKKAGDELMRVILAQHAEETDDL